MTPVANNLFDFAQDSSGMSPGLWRLRLKSDFEEGDSAVVSFQRDGVTVWSRTVTISDVTGSDFEITVAD